MFDPQELPRSPCPCSQEITPPGVIPMVSLTPNPAKLDIARMLLFSFVFFFFTTHPVGALDTNRQLSQYGHTAWRVEDGVFAGMPNVIAQTTDGYLWIGTQVGLTRFDGVRFVSWRPPIAFIPHQFSTRSAGWKLVDWNHDGVSAFAEWKTDQL
jgi:ligand-binding sensor domain-containing protein